MYACSYARFLASQAYRTLVAHLQQKHQDDDQSTRSRAGSGADATTGGGMVAISPPLVPQPPSSSMAHVPHDMILPGGAAAATAVVAPIAHTNSNTHVVATINRSHSNHSPMHAWTTRGTMVTAALPIAHAAPPRVKSSALVSRHSSSVGASPAPAASQPVPTTAAAVAATAIASMSGGSGGGTSDVVTAMVPSASVSLVQVRDAVTPIGTGGGGGMVSSSTRTQH